MNTIPTGLDDYEDLTISHQRQFLGLLRKHPESRPHVLSLLASGALTIKDKRTGRSTLSHLSTLSIMPLAESLESESHPVSDLIRNLVDPTVIHQSQRNTCTVTTLEYLLAKEEPAEYARLAVGLFSQMGEAVLADGTVLSRPESALPSDDTSRNVVSRIFQSSLMDTVNGVFDYDNSTDQNRWRAITRPWEGVLDPRAFGEVLSSATGREYASHLHLPGLLPGSGKLASSFSKIEEAVDVGESVPVSLAWGSGGHVLLIEKNLGNGVYLLRNPWGHSESGQELSGRFSPLRKPHRTVGQSGGLIEMTSKELKRYLLAYWIPSAAGS